MTGQKDLLFRYQQSLSGLKRRHRLRSLKPPHNGVDFSSNDYLGLANHPRMKAAAERGIELGLSMGSTGSRLLTGNHEQHQKLETTAAQTFGSEQAIFFANGFMANYALFTCLPKAGDLVIYDELVHASIHDGMLAGKAKIMAAQHNEAQDFEAKIKAASPRLHLAPT